MHQHTYRQGSSLSLTQGRLLRGALGGVSQLASGLPSTLLRMLDKGNVLHLLCSGMVGILSETHPLTVHCLLRAFWLPEGLFGFLRASGLPVHFQFHVALSTIQGLGGLDLTQAMSRMHAVCE